MSKVTIPTNPSLVAACLSSHTYSMSLEVLCCCVLILPIVLAGSQSCLLIHPRVSLIGLRIVLRKGG